MNTAKIYAFLLSKSGWLVKGPIAAGVAFASTQLQRIGIQLTEEQQISATVTITTAIIAMGESWLRNRDDKNKQIVQRELGLPEEKVDTFIGPATVQAAKSAVQPSDLAPALKTAVRQDVAKKKARTGLKHQNRP